MRKNKRKEKSIVVSQNVIHIFVPPTFLSGSTPLHECDSRTTDRPRYGETFSHSHILARKECYLLTFYTC